MEAAGIVDQIGEGVSGIDIGARYCTLPYFYFNKGASADYVTIDARYVTPAPDNYWLDIDSDSWGSGDSSLYCTLLGEVPTSNTTFVSPPAGWVTNNDDNCPNITNEDQWKATKSRGIPDNRAKSIARSEIQKN